MILIARFQVSYEQSYDYFKDETTTTIMILNVWRNEDLEKNPSLGWDMNPQPSMI